MIWKLAHQSPGLTVWNRDGKWWYELRRPPRLLHRHRAQTKAILPTRSYVTYRCACGATGYSDIGGWTKRER